MNRIVVHIDRLVLRGVDHVDPAALQAALQADRNAGATPKVRLLSISFDGAHDTPAVLQAYARSLQADPALCGDEPLLLARSSGAPVFVCPDRVAAGQIGRAHV